MMSDDTVIASLKEQIDDLNQQAWEARVNDSPKAFQLSQESVTLARSINYSKGLAEGLRSLGFGYVRLFKNDEAAPLLRESLFLFQSLNDVKGQAVVYEYLGIIERNWGNLGASLELLLKGYALIQQVGSIEIEVTCCYQIGVTYKHLGNHENALDYLYRALSIAKKSNIALMEAYAINIIGSIYFDNGDYNDALDCYQRGLVIRQESHDKWGEAGSLDNIGFTYLKLNDLDKAIDHCKQSLKITQSTGDKKGEANTLLHLAEIFEQAGDIGQAAKFSNESLEIRKARGDRRGEAEVLLFLADLYKHRSDAEDHQIFEWLSGALKIADEIKAQDLLSKASYNLHEYHGQKGNHKESLIQLEAHLQIEKELHKNMINQKVANLEISHKAEVISEKNKELIELNERIETANAELKIEASLERVRAVAMGMKEPADMINVCRMISDQLQQLGFKEIRNVQTVIIYPQKHEYLNYQYFTPYDKDSIETIDYRLHPDVLEFTNQMLASADAYYTKTFEGEELKVWREYRKQTNQLPDPKLDATTSSHYYFYSIGSGALGVTAYAPLNEEQIGLFKRFRNVFELAYRRFIDIEKALAQAREAQIEAALERVRAKSMAMHHSDDLITVINVVQEQLLGLGFHFHGANFVTDYSEKGYTMWLASPGESFPYKIYVPQIGQKYFEAVNKAIEKGSDFATYTLNFEEKNSYFKNLFENSLAKNTSEQGKRTVYESKGMAASVVLLDKVRLNLMNLDLVPFTDEENNILKRFGYVFEQSYTRFLDLQKAEAQAREAQIEAALERVRSRTMGMHKSDELREVVVVLFTQLQQIGFDIKFCTIALIDKINSTVEFWLSGFSQEILPESYHVPNLDHPFYQNFQSTFRQGAPYKVFELAGEEKRSYDKLWFTLTDFKNLPEPVKKPMMEMERVVLSCAFTKNGMIQIGGFESLSETDALIIQRFAKVFEQTYTRFLDLQKAEAQAREAKIEAALERVRSRTMAMHKSDELAEVATVLFEQMSLLDNTPDRFNIRIANEAEGVFEFWATDQEGQLVNKFFRAAFDRSPVVLQMYTSWKAKEKILIQDLHGDQLSEWVHYIRDELGVPFNSNRLKEHRFLSSVFFSHGMIGITTNDTPNPVTLQLIERFAKVFEQTYTRFLDLQKAEAQAREARIEVALERVRAKAMAMHKSDDLKMAVATVFEELDKLNIGILRCGIAIMDKEKPRADVWITVKSEQTNTIQVSGDESLDYHPLLRGAYDGWVKQEDFSYVLQGEDLLSYYRDVASMKYQLPVSTPFDKEKIDQQQYYFNAVFQDGSLFAFMDTAFTDEAKMVMKRFANVFNLTYKRFLDLQKAEAQAREAQIELGLERVRARAMAMQKSAELKELIATVSTELTKLDLVLDRCVIMTYDIKTLGMTWWMANPETSSDPIGLYVKYHEQAPYLAFLKAWQDRVVKWQYLLEGSVKKTWDEFLFVETELSRLPGFVIDNMRGNDKVYLSASFNNFGCLTLATLEPLSDEQFDIMLRFAKVFDLTYTRFNDLKQAEAQAREARIEAALEKVRASTMAMQRSEDLSQTAFVLFNQFKELGEAPERIFIATFDDHDSGVIDLWGTDQGGNQLNKLFRLPVNEPTMVSKIIAAWKEKKRSVVIDLKGEELKTYLGFLKQAGIPVTEGVMTDRRVQTAACFSNGVIGVTTPEAQSAEAVQLQERFAGVFDLTYTRFLDLQKAEEQAHKAQIETALERVRARALAMQEPEELKDVAHVLRTEMGLLGVEELETCSIYIHDQSAEKAECWYALKDIRSEEKKLVNDHFALNLGETWVGREMLRFYQSPQKQISIVMQGENRKEWIRYCEEHSAPFRGYYGEVIPDRTYHLYKFSHGAIGAAAAGDISEESWRMLSRAASVFSLAYSRFKDLTQARTDLIKLKEEKKRAEEALTELQATQKQLIQSEKMASLGELTAGIAHEIQNPLNFVNNFSDVSNELLEEMKTELEKGNTREAKAIAVDVKENLEKILHHGKRADAIVKGMLQHSRSSSGQKELTDINTLAEEYLRLAYHGLRAKDKFFNAKFETDLDPSLDKINVVPQEIGRVILNLINNSFYAVTEKKRSTGNGYEPSVTVSTKRINDKVEIKVKDNGNGIPQKVLDKIFQPFFTTKPTGQGTGLGLSLSYDIITKGHLGEIKVETKEGEGSEFTISLPMN